MLANEDCEYPLAVKGWELKVLERELADTDLVAWYRNPVGGNAALRVPYRTGQFDKSMYPDFIMIHDTDEGPRRRSSIPTASTWLTPPQS